MTKPISEMSMEELEEYFDNGGDISELFEGPDVVIERPSASQLKQVSISLPEWLVFELDREAARRGVARKALINTALVEWIDEAEDRARARGDRNPKVYYMTKENGHVRMRLLGQLSEDPELTPEGA